MTKKDMAEIIASSPVWNGASASWLIKNCTKEQLKDLMWQIEYAEEDYYERRW